ncbi:hypothetical protein Tco_1397471, partial [Tanacetum coccineum]
KDVESLGPSEMADDNEVIPDSFNEGDTQDQKGDEKGEDTFLKKEENNSNNDGQSKMEVNQSGNRTAESNSSFPPGFNGMRFHSMKEKSTE